MTAARSTSPFLDLTDALGRTRTSNTVLCHKPRGGDFQTVHRGSLQEAANRVPEAPGDVYYFVQPLLPPSTGRGKASDTIGIRTLFADLDGDPGKLESFGNCEAVVEAVSDLLNAATAGVVNSGHGLQPYWIVVGTGTTWAPDDDVSRQRAARVLKRFGRVVEAVAEQTMGMSRDAYDLEVGHERPASSSAAWVDAGVYELGRVLRVPGTTNYKAEPVAATLESVQPLARPLTLDEIEIICDRVLGPMDGPVRPGLAPPAQVASYSAAARGDLLRFSQGLRRRGVEPTSHQADGYQDNKEWRSTCPAHGLDGAAHSEDALAFGLSTRWGDPRLVWYCYAGCGQHEVAESIGFKLSDRVDQLDLRGSASRLEFSDEARAELEADPQLRQTVEQQWRTERARELVAEARGKVHRRVAPDVGTLAEILARPAGPPQRIEGLIPAGGRLLLTAQRKVGKTTMVGNLARSLLSGEPFLGRFGVRPLEGSLVVLNYEVSAATFATWMSEIGVPEDRLIVVNVRGRQNLLADATGREALVRLALEAEAEALIVDPFGRAFTGKSQNEATEVSQWLGRLDEVAEESGCSELIVTAHAGWDGDRTRGSSALEDWPDVIAVMTRDATTDQRFLRADGRDVFIAEDALEYDPDTRLLTASGAGSRATVTSREKQLGLVQAVVAEVTARPGLNVAALEKALQEDGHRFQHGAVGRAAGQAVDAGLLRRELGPRNSKLFYLTESVVPSSPDPSRGPLSSSPDPSYKDGTAGGLLQAVSPPRGAEGD